MKSGIGTYLARYRRSFAEVLPISAWVFEESAGAKKTFGDMNKARIYLDEQRIRGDESNCYTRGNVTSWLCFDIVPEELRSEC